MMQPEIQARGALIACNSDGVVVTASANAAEFFGGDPLGKDLRDVLGLEGLHAVRNTAAVPLASERSVFSGRVDGLDLHVCVQGGFTVVEAEKAETKSLPDAYGVERDVALIAGAKADDLLVSLIQTLSGFERASVGRPEGLMAGVPQEVLSGRGLYVVDDATREGVPLLGEAVPLALASLRLPGEDALGTLSMNGIRAVTVLVGERRVLVLRHSRPRMPSHHARLVLLHLARIL